MGPSTGERLMQVARLRRVAAVLVRGGARPLAAQVLQRLALTGHDSGLDGQAVRAAWHAAAISHLDDDPLDRVQSLIVLAATLLSTDATRGAVTAGELARAEAERVDGASREVALGLAALVEGMGRRASGRAHDAAVSLHEARERLVAAQQPSAAAIALTELGLLDHDGGAVDRALVCFAFARELHRAAGDAAAAGRLAQDAVGLMIDARRWEAAAALAAEGVDDAQRGDDARLAAHLAAAAADCLWRADAPAARIDEADAIFARCHAGVDPAAPLHPLLEIQARVRHAGRRGGDADALRQLEAAFDAAMSADREVLLDLLDWTVSHLAAATLPSGGWALLARLAPEMRARGHARVAELVGLALERVRATA